MSEPSVKNEVNIVEVSQLRPMLQTFNEELGRYINERDRFKLGRVLTIIDASFSDPEQRKSVKDLVNNMWWGDMNMPSDIPMVSPHTDIRGLTTALGFELYVMSDLPAQLKAPDQYWAQSRAIERYQTIAEQANKSK